jgi:restriction system protein
MVENWQDYQEEAASFFRSLGLEATTNVTVKGVRTNHDIDVLVKSHHAGFDVTWLVECKYWKNAVSKLHVLGLREIVVDVGADRGILLSEAGFQSGAIEAANLTNVHVTSLAQLRLSASGDIYAMRLRELFDRTEKCRQRYWDIPKDDRIEHGLRSYVGVPGYSGYHVIDYCSDLLAKAFRGVFPLEVENLLSSAYPDIPYEFTTPNEVVEELELLISELESKLDTYENGSKDN